MKKNHFLVLVLHLSTIGAVAQKSEIYAPGGKAIDGYDPVAFFITAKPVKGVDSLAYSWKGSVWLLPAGRTFAVSAPTPKNMHRSMAAIAPMGLRRDIRPRPRSTPGQSSMASSISKIGRAHV